MVRRTYTGLINAEAEFEKLRPLVRELRSLQARCKPFGRDYHAFEVALSGLETTAYHFTRRPGFFGDRGEQR